MEREYYLYRWIRLDKNIPFYVGIGTKPLTYPTYYQEYSRAFVTNNRNIFFKRVFNKTQCKVEIIYESSSKEEILEKEKEFINLYGRRNLDYNGTLVNINTGGLGCPGNQKKLRKSKDIFYKKNSLLKDLIEIHGDNLGRKLYKEKMIQSGVIYKKRVYTEEQRKKAREHLDRIRPLSHLKPHNITKRKGKKPTPIYRISPDLTDITFIEGGISEARKNTLTNASAFYESFRIFTKVKGNFYCYEYNLEKTLNILKDKYFKKLAL